MLRVERRGGSVLLVSRLAVPRVLAVLAVALGAAALASARPLPRLAASLAVAAALVVALGGRAVRARFERGRVRVRTAVPFQREREHALAEFQAARVETVAEERRRKAERLARAYRDRSGSELPEWIRPPDAPGVNDQLRRIVLVPGQGEPLAVTAWLADDDLERARADVDALLRG